MASRRNKTSGLSGFVSFMKRRDAEEALRELDGFDWGGSILRVGWSKAVPVGARPMYSTSPSFLPPANYLLNLTFPQRTPRQVIDVPGPGRGPAMEIEARKGPEKEVGLALDTTANTRVGGVDPARIVRAVLGHPGGEITEIEIAGVTTEGGQGPTAGHVHPEGMGIEVIPETRMKRNSWVMMTLLKSSFGLLPWKSKAEAKNTKLL